MTRQHPDALRLSGDLTPKFLARGFRITAIGGSVTVRQRGETLLVIPAGKTGTASGYVYLSGPAEAVLEPVR